MVKANRKKIQKYFYSKTVFSLLILAVAVISFANFPAGVARAAALSLAPVAVGDSDLWAANTGSKVDAVASNDGDASFISSSSALGDAQTFSFAPAGLPAGATVNSVTFTVLAKKSTDSGSLNSLITLRAENATTTVNNIIPDTLSDSSAYSPFTWTMVNNPLSNSPWTVSDVNTWNIKFGIAKADNFSQVTAMATQMSLTVDYTVHPGPAANPALASQVCGLDIALVLDNSGSIGGNLPTMKSSFNSFVNSLLPATPTGFSVTYFDGTAHYAQATFSNSASATVAAINSVPASAGQTDWEDALIKAQATLDPRPGSAHPNLIIFASDGQPNRYGPNGTLGVGGTVDPNALDAAVAEANLVKASGTRIVTLGIGNGVGSGQYGRHFQRGCLLQCQQFQ